MTNEEMARINAWVANQPPPKSKNYFTRAERLTETTGESVYGAVLYYEDGSKTECKWSRGVVDMPPGLE